MSSKRVFLSESEMPTAWYNLQADLPEPVPPPLHPATNQPMGPADLEPIFAKALIAQEVSQERWIEIPRGRAGRLRHLASLAAGSGDGAGEGAEDAGADLLQGREPQSAGQPQAEHGRAAGLLQQDGRDQPAVDRDRRRAVGQLAGVRLLLFDMECKVYMVKVSYQQKPYRRSMMHIWGGDVTPSPSTETEAGRQILAADPDCPGSLGIAISEAVEVAATRDDTKYTLGSVLNHVMLHQTVIGLEAEKQFELVGDSPDVVIGCVGGGSNFAGLAFPFIRRKLEGKDIRFVACEPCSCPSMSRGQYRYDFGDTTKLTPLIKMFTLGHSFVPPGIHAGGLRYHGMAPMVSLAAKLGIIEAAAFHQIECFEAAKLFAATEGIIPAPETSHAIRGAIVEAIRCREENKEECIVFNFSGHGLCDLGSYDRYFSGELEDYEYPQEKIEEAIAELPVIE